jgi:hypothetical protein
MATQCLIFAIQPIPGEEPRAVEQINGDLLLPSAGRPLLEQALLMAEDALGDECKAEKAKLADVRRLLGIQKVDRQAEERASNLLKVRAI